jgi:hypothetical protein
MTSVRFQSSHGGEYEAQNLLGCTSVFLTKCLPTFQRYVLPHRSDDLGSTYLYMSVDIQLRTRQYIPEDSELQDEQYPLVMLFNYFHATLFIFKSMAWYDVSELWPPTSL